MLVGPLVFVDVDTQRDFLDPEGVLFIAGSEIILPNLERLTRHARLRGIPVIATACAHSPDDKEFEAFPPHCVVGTHGQERITATAWPGSCVLQPEARLSGDIPAHLTVQKHELDVFSHPEANRLIALYGQGAPLFVVYGVATDYCVLKAVLGLTARGQRVAVVVDAVRPFDLAREPAIFADFLDRGSILVATDAIVGV